MIIEDRPEWLSDKCSLWSDANALIGFIACRNKLGLTCLMSLLEILFGEFDKGVECRGKQAYGLMLKTRDGWRLRR